VQLQELGATAPEREPGHPQPHQLDEDQHEQGAKPRPTGKQREPEKLEPNKALGESFATNLLAAALRRLSRRVRA
jgi:hypothetical protein